MPQTANDRLRQARIDAGYKTAAEFAAHIGIEAGTYRHHENGNRGVPVAAARRYAKALGVDLQWILAGEPAKDELAALTPEDRAMLVRFKALTPEKRKAFLEVLPEPPEQPHQEE